MQVGFGKNDGAGLPEFADLGSIVGGIDPASAIEPAVVGMSPVS